MQEIKFVFFDLGNVLVKFDHELAVQQMAAIANVDVDLVRQTVFNSELLSQYERGEITTAEFARRFCVATDSTPDADELMYAASDIFQINAEMIPIVSGLASCDFPIGILSNTCDAHWSFLLKKLPAFLDLLPVRALSFEQGCVKPEATIYSVAAELAGVPQDQIFFTDDRADNVEGAVEAGMHAVLFQSAQQLANELRKLKIQW